MIGQNRFTEQALSEAALGPVGLYNLVWEIQQWFPVVDLLAHLELARVRETAKSMAKRGNPEAYKLVAETIEKYLVIKPENRQRLEDRLDEILAELRVPPSSEED